MSKKTGDFLVCKESADQFYKVAKWCEDRDALEFLNETMYPYAVNVSFACELYLKAIMLKRSGIDEFTQGHNLLDLFNSLDVQDKTNLETEFAQKYSEKTLIDFLDENKDVFISWRYALEKDVQINYSGFTAFAEVLNRFVEDMKNGIR